MTLRFELTHSRHSAPGRLTDGQQLAQCIRMLRADGQSYREIGAALGIHWTRVGQILRGQG
jgi:hypothetical protein